MKTGVSLFCVQPYASSPTVINFPIHTGKDADLKGCEVIPFHCIALCVRP